MSQSISTNLFRLFLVLLLAAPWLGLGSYPMHLIIMSLLLGFIYTSWALMGRLGLVSLGHGAFLGIGAYSVVLLWNQYGLSPFVGTFVAVAVTVTRHEARLSLSLAVGFFVLMDAFKYLPRGQNTQQKKTIDANTQKHYQPTRMQTRE